MGLPLLCKKLKDKAELPTKNKGDIGWDICCIVDEDFENHKDTTYYKLKPRHSHIFHTGIATQIPEGYAALLWDRGGMGAKKLIHRLAGVIDSSYRGEWLICLTNLGDEEQIISPGDKIVQAIIQKEVEIEPKWVEELDETERGEGRFASTGK